MMENLSEERIEKIAEYIAKTETKDFILLLRNQYNIESALDVIGTWIKISGYPYSHHVHFNKESYVINHNMGRKWSIYLSKLYQFIFEQFGIGRVEFSIEDNTLSFTVDADRYYV